jgi:hypothetical protein
MNIESSSSAVANSPPPSKKAKTDAHESHATSSSSSSSSSAGREAVVLPITVQAFVSQDPSLILSEAADNNAALETLIAYTTDFAARATNARAALAMKAARGEAERAAKLAMAEAAAKEESEECYCCGSKKAEKEAGSEAGSIEVTKRVMTPCDCYEGNGLCGIRICGECIGKKQEQDDTGIIDIDDDAAYEFVKCSGEGCEHMLCYGSCDTISCSKGDACIARIGKGKNLFCSECDEYDTATMHKLKSRFQSCTACADSLCRACANDTFVSCESCETMICEDCITETPCGNVDLCENCVEDFECDDCDACLRFKWNEQNPEYGQG